MTNEVVSVNSQVVQPVDMTVINEYLDATGLTKRLDTKEKAMFVNMAKLYGLNPFKREIYCTVYGEGQSRQCSIVTGYEVYLKRAERIGKLDGWEVTTDGKVGDGTLSATVVIHRKDWSYPFKHTVYFREVCQTRKDGKLNKFWEKQPYFMCKKVGIAQAFRLCFPDEFGGMPYTSDELGVESTEAEERDVTPSRQEQQVPVVPVQPAISVQDVTPVQSPVPVAPTQPAGVSDARLALEQLIDKYGINLRDPKAKVQPYTIAKACLDNPNATDEELIAMHNRCTVFLQRKGVA